MVDGHVVQDSKETRAAKVRPTQHKRNEHRDAANVLTLPPRLLCFLPQKIQRATVKMLTKKYPGVKVEF